MNHAKFMMQELVDYVTAQPDYSIASEAFVSVYRHHKCYGGPEEGGWWYDVVKLEGSKSFPSKTMAEAWLETAKAEVERRNKAEAPMRAMAYAGLPDCDEEALPDAGEGFIPVDWDDGGELMVVVEDHSGSLDNSHEARPHYE